MEPHRKGTQGLNRHTRQRSISGQAVRFALLSAISFVGYLGLTALMHEGLGLSSYVAVPIAMACITLFNFFSLRLVIFKPTTRGWFAELLGFLASIAGFRVAEYAAFIVLHGLLDLPYLPAYAAILATSAVCKFLFLRNILFASATTPAPLAEPTP